MVETQLHKFKKNVEEKTFLNKCQNNKVKDCNEHLNII